MKLAHSSYLAHALFLVADAVAAAKVNADFSLLAAVTNLARLAVLGLHSAPEGWAAVSG